MRDPEKETLIDDLEQAVETLHENAERIKTLEKNWAESEWYLGEAKGRTQRLEETRAYLQELRTCCRLLEEQLEKLKPPA